jgi:DNA-binding transcriptional regulator YhcF (GntR family)
MAQKQTVESNESAGNEHQGINFKDQIKNAFEVHTMTGKVKSKIPLPSQRNMPTIHQVKEHLNNLRSHLNT